MSNQVVRKFYEAWSDGNVVELFCAVREDVDLCAPMAFGLPMGGRCRGRAQLEGFFRLVRDGIELSHFEVREVVERGDVVVVLGASSGVVRHTGRSFSTTWAHVFTVQQGRIARVRVFFDRGVVAEALSTPGRLRDVTPRRYAA